MLLEAKPSICLRPQGGDVHVLGNLVYMYMYLANVSLLERCPHLKGVTVLYEELHYMYIHVQGSPGRGCRCMYIHVDIPCFSREGVYLRGGVVFITSRILVVDILRKQCPVDHVAGILVWNAHK